MFMDDGSRTWYDYDQTNERGDRIWSNHVDASGREDWANITMDDGRRKWYDYDQDGSQGWSRFEADFDAGGRQDFSTRFFDDGSRLFVDYDYYGAGNNKLLGYDAFGRDIYLGEQVHGVVVSAVGSWNPKYGAGLSVGAVIAAPGAAPVPQPTYPQEPFDDPYPGAHVEVGPIEPSDPW
jgi:hypothetical protein